MSLIKYAFATAMVLAAAGTAQAQPQHKLVRDLDKGTIQAIWCSSLFFEESYYHESGGRDATRYEDMAFELGADLDGELIDTYGLRQEEVDEIWSVFDSAAYDMAELNDETFLEQVEACESGYDALL